jgi:hypothetical protein
MFDNEVTFLSCTSRLALLVTSFSRSLPRVFLERPQACIFSLQIPESLQLQRPDVAAALPPIITRGGSSGGAH